MRTVYRLIVLNGQQILSDRIEPMKKKKHGRVKHTQSKSKINQYRDKKKNTSFDMSHNISYDERHTQEENFRFQ